MATRRRTLLLVFALGFSAALVPATLASAGPAQDPGATFGGEVTTTLAVTTTVPGATTTTKDATNQTLVESEDQPETSIFSESRKVQAVIGGLVFVALAILLLTVRYIRVTKPVAPGDVSDLPFLAEDVDVEDDDVFVADLNTKAKQAAPVIPDAVPEVAMASARSETGATDHAGADADWEPKTDEHQRVEIPTGASMARPGVAARRRALGLSPD